MIATPDGAPPPRRVVFTGQRVVLAGAGDASVQTALLATELRLEGAQIARASFSSRLPGPFARLAHLREGLAAAAFRGELREALAPGADVVQVEAVATPDGVRAARLAHTAARAARVRLVVRLVGGDVTGIDDVLSDADAVVAPSPRVQDALRKRAGVEARVVPDLVEDTGYDAPAARREGPLRVLCARGLEAVHGVDRVLRAAAQAREAGADLHLTVAGEGRERRALERLASEILPGRVAFLGARGREAVVAALRASDLLVDASASADPHAAAGDSLAEGVPVLAASPVPDWRIDDGETGVLHGPADLDGLARTIEWLAADRASLLALAWRAKIRSLRWTWDALRADWAAVLLGVRVPIAHA